MTKIGGSGSSIPQPPPTANAAAASSAATKTSGKADVAAPSPAPLASPRDTFERVGDAAAGGRGNQAPGSGDLFDRVGGPVKGGKTPGAARPPKGLPAEKPGANAGVWQAMKDAAETGLDAVTKALPNAVGDMAVPKELEKAHEKALENMQENRRRVNAEIIRHLRG